MAAASLRRQLPCTAYTVAWITILRVEHFAALSQLEEEHLPPEPLDNRYTYNAGTINGHNIVIARTGETGPNKARECAEHIRNNFPNIEFGLLVGIAGGLPGGPNRDIRLGDIVVSKPEKGHGGVAAYEGHTLGRDGIKYLRHLGLPPPHVVSAIYNMETQLERGHTGFNEALALMRDKFPKYGSRPVLEDVLYTANDADIVDTSREARASDGVPHVHYGLMASGPVVIKTSGIDRRDITKRLDILGSDPLCFEMEACGVMDSFPFLVIRGISDYCDCHKNDEWQPFAAAVAACYAKWLLQVLRLTRRAKQVQDEHAVGMGLHIATGNRVRTQQDSKPTAHHDNASYRAERSRIVDYPVSNHPSHRNARDVHTIDYENREPLQTACWDGDAERVEALLQNGADIEANSDSFGTGLQAASFQGHDKIVKMLIDYGADLNANDENYVPALLGASCQGHDKVVQMLIKSGADVNAQDNNYGTALGAASFEGHNKVVQMLINYGADVNAQDDGCGTALQAASSEGHDKTVEILIHCGANVNAQSGDSYTALELASLEGHENIVGMLLHYGADVNHQDNDHISAVRAALYHGHDKIVAMLIDNGAVVHAYKWRFERALQDAVHRRDFNLVRYLSK